MTVRECFNAMQEPYRTQALNEVDNVKMLDTEIGKISDAVKRHLIYGDSTEQGFNYWHAYYTTLINLHL